MVAEHDLIFLENEPILATDAVRVMTDNVNQDEAVLLLGHPLKIAAEREVSSHLTDYKKTSCRSLSETGGGEVPVLLLGVADSLGDPGCVHGSAGSLATVPDVQAVLGKADIKC